MNFQEKSERLIAMQKLCLQVEQDCEWDGAKKLDTTISQEAILKDTGVTRKCDNIQKNSNAK